MYSNRNTNDTTTAAAMIETTTLKHSTASDEFVIRKMTADDIDEALSLFATHHMYESAVTVRAFLDCDPNGFYVAIDAQTGKLVGVCGAPVLKPGQGFFGLYGVLKEYQSRGIGRQLFDLCSRNIGGENCGLHAVSAMFDKYFNKGGFRVRENRSMVVFGGYPKNLDKIKPPEEKSSGGAATKKLLEIIPFNIRDLENSAAHLLLTKIIDYDSKVHLFRREKVLTLTLSSEKCFTAVAVENNNKSSSPDILTVIGFGCVKPDAGNHAMLGPVYADNDSAAEALIFSLIKRVNLADTNGLNYMVLDRPDGGLKIAHKLGLNEVERCERLFTKFPIPARHELIYVLHSPEFSL